MVRDCEGGVSSYSNKKVNTGFAYIYDDEYPYLTEEDEFDCENGSSVDLKLLVNSLRKEIARLRDAVNALVEQKQ